MHVYTCVHGTNPNKVICISEKMSFHTINLPYVFCVCVCVCVCVCERNISSHCKGRTQIQDICEQS
jgi:hypothetical protein